MRSTPSPSEFSTMSSPALFLAGLHTTWLLRRGLLAAALLCLVGNLRLAAQAIAPFPIAPETPSAIAFADAAEHSSPAAAVAATPRRHRVVATFGPYTRHSGPGNYNSKPNFTTLERETVDHRSVGLSYFKNSFWQPCWFAHVGRRFTFSDRDEGFFVKIAAGVIYGYRSPHEKSVPLNYHGVSPAIIPSIGYKFKHTSVQLVVFGKNAGQIPMLSHDLR